MERPKQIHMIAICGVGMTALAGLLKEAGHSVSGSDRSIFPPMSELLSRIGIVCQKGFHPDHIAETVDCVIIGNAVRRDNPEVKAAFERGLLTYSMPQALRHFFLEAQRLVLVVAGTHGKTTTASLLAFILTEAGLDPGVMVGGIIKNFGRNYRLGSGDYFVVEGDEYNSAFFDPAPKWLHYRPSHAILTSIDMDHADIYPNLSALQEAFKRFVRLIPKEGLLVGSDEPSVLEAAQEAACRVATYGLSPTADWQATSIQYKEKATSFDLLHRRTWMGRVTLPLMGRHNVKNALAVAALAYSLGIPVEALVQGLSRFSGVARRQDVVGEINKILIVDDFAHHPTAISETLFALRSRYPKRRLWAVFEPRSASSRRNIFQEQFVSAFQEADGIILSDLFAPETVPAEQRLNPHQVILDLKRMGKEAFFIPTADQIVSFLPQRLQPGDLVCIMSSGAFDGIHVKLMARLQETPLSS